MSMTTDVTTTAPSYLSEIQATQQTHLAKLKAQGIFEVAKYEAVQKYAFGGKAALLKPKSIQQVIQAQSPSLATISKYTASKTTYALIIVLIQPLLDFYNVGNPMTMQQVAMLCELIAEEYHYLSIGDLNLFFRRARLGEYEKVYDRFDGGVVMTWLRKYIEQRNVELQDLRTQESSQQKDLCKQPFSFSHAPPEIQEKLKALQQKLQTKPIKVEKQHFWSLEEYFFHYRIDPDEGYANVEANIRFEYAQQAIDPKRITWEDFVAWKCNEYLYLINHKS